MLTEQNGVCAICGKPESTVDKRANRIRLLAVDHNHTSGIIRGLLCNSCNRILGFVDDNTEHLQMFINYLNKHKD